jgi:staphylococcal nuclease domain-containing protein 1
MNITLIQNSPLIFQVNVSMEYSRRINIADGQIAGPRTNSTETRVLEYGSVFLPSSSHADGETATSSSDSSNNQLGINVAALLVSRGLADITRHRDYEDRSHHYDALIAAHARAEKTKKGYHSKKECPPIHMTDLTRVNTIYSVL